MSWSPRDKQQLAHLLTCMSDGTITEPELRLLESLLLDNPAAQTFYHQQLALDVELSWLFADVPPPMPADPPVAARLQRAAPRPARFQRVAVRLGLPVAAALAAVVLAVLWCFRSAEQPQPGTVPEVVLARLVELTGEAQVSTGAGDLVAAVVGQELFAGQTLQTSSHDSFAVVEYPDTTRLELHADTMAQLLLREATVTDKGGKKVFLSRGLLRADVARQPTGGPLVLATPHAEIRVLGTRFASAIAPEATRIELEEGRVQLTRQADGKVIEVEKGFYAVATSLPEPLRQHPLPKQLITPRAVLQTRASDVAFSRDGSTLATATKQGVLFWDPLTGQKKGGLPCQRPPRFLTYSPDGTTLATLGEDQLIRHWNLTTGQERLVLRGPERGFGRMAFSPDGQVLATLDHAAQKKTFIRLWNLACGLEQPALEAKNEAALSLVFSPQGQLATGTNKGRVHFWDLTTGQIDSSIQVLRKKIDLLAFSPEGRLLAIPNQENNAVLLWDLTTGAEAKRLLGCERAVTTLAFSPDGSLLATGTIDGNVLLWRLGTAEEVLTIRAGKGAVSSLAFSPDGNTLVTALGKQPVQLWSLTGE